MGKHLHALSRCFILDWGVNRRMGALMGAHARRISRAKLCHKSQKVFDFEKKEARKQRSDKNPSINY